MVFSRCEGPILNLTAYSQLRNWKARPFTLLLLERSHALKNDSTDEPS
ncbi:hypothetical protein NC653_029162 [Populus alba x Populus x berolinensis]|uniref:Uncharacterized protein n=1 Tax=Populus alba x Populus x berolinensis TaxID=444605 RepID=A0AAD6M1T2_9ROSI|nr:hypothetical protein NC653_029162 [Populus alba x Populus x berolinensis]